MFYLTFLARDFTSAIAIIAIESIRAELDILEEISSNMFLYLFAFTLHR